MSRVVLPQFSPRVLILAMAVVFALALANMSGGTLRAQEPTPSIAINQLDAGAYPEMTAVVTVLDVNGAPVRGLAATSFNANDGGAPVEVVAAQPALDSSLRLGVVLVMDVSGSMEGQPLAAAKAAATAFVRQLDPDDEAALIAFADDARLVLDFTTDREALVGAIDGLVAVGATSLYEAVQVAVFAASSSQAPRQAIVMLSDGENDTTTSTVTEDASLGSAAGAGVPAFAIGFGGGADPAYLGRLADTSGGRYFEASATDVAAVYATIAEQLRGQYALTLRSAAAADGGNGALVVAADVAGQRVESAPSSFVRGEAPPAPAPTPAPASGAVEREDGGTSIVPIVIGVVAAAVVAGAIVVFGLRRVDARRKQRAREREAGRQSDEAVPAPLPGVPFAQAPDRLARVSALSGAEAGASWEFGTVPIVFGSDRDAHVRLERSREVAPKHAMLWVREGKIMLRHTGGVRQTFSAGRPVDWLILEEGDEFSIGPYVYRVESVATSNGAAPSAGTGASS